ncbi:hypothetical protein [Nocardia sp. NPDC019395]|uniref:hypothetical protein n=1 Tax=Nocardia sp. NPDC019395 TaxID=3154686 RepID=UPI0033F085D2
MDHRMSVLQLDKDTVLPLAYEYVPAEKMFRTMGFVRTPTMMIPSVAHRGADTPGQRDLFLAKVLTGLQVSPRDIHRITAAAVHSTDRGFGAESVPGIDSGTGTLSDGTERDGLHMLWPGVVLGVVVGVLAGYIVAGWDGVAIGAFVGSSTLSELFPAGWRLFSRRSYLTIQDTLASAMIAAGSAVGAWLGYVLGGDGGPGRAAGVFLGMSIGALVLSLLATTYSMVPLRNRAMTWFGPLIVGGVTWAVHAVWHSPVALALGVIIGFVVASIVAPLAFPLSDTPARGSSGGW